MLHVNSVGSLTVIHGPMKAGKTAKLLSELSRYADTDGAEHQVIYINSSTDTRSDTAVSTNCKGSIEFSSNILKVKTDDLDNINYDKYDIIGVDEAQFQQNLKKSVQNWLQHGKIIIVAGLMSDFRMQAFPNSELLDLIPIADQEIRLYAYCVGCSEEGDPRNKFTRAPFTCRLSDDQNVVKIGDKEYIPVCRHHHFIFSNNQEQRLLISQKLL